MLARNRITHLFDCAGVGDSLVREANRQNLPWGQIQGPWMHGNTSLSRFRFFCELAAMHPLTRLWHVHMGGRAKWARGRFERPYVLTLHGTDIRETYWQSEYHDVLKEDIDRAQHVFYTTPDLQEKALSARGDAEYMPPALNLGILPAWSPAPKPRVFFPSRWDQQKGGEKLIGIAAELVAAVGTRADVVGLDWGNLAPEAADAGVQLVPRMPVADYLQELARSHVAIGQLTGLLGISELQTMAIGVPLIFADPHESYMSGERVGAVAVESADLTSAVVETLADPLGASAALQGKQYVRRHHDAAVLIPRLLEVYGRI